MFLPYVIDLSLLEIRSGIWFKDMHLGVMLTRGGLVTANLDCYLDWMKKYLGN